MTGRCARTQLRVSQAALLRPPRVQHAWTAERHGFQAPLFCSLGDAECNYQISRRVVSSAPHPRRCQGRPRADSENNLSVYEYTFPS